MRKLESQMCFEWRKMLNTVPGMLAHERIENAVKSGTPDYTYTLKNKLSVTPVINGWIEFKVGHIPVKPETKIKLHHWTLPQREWMRARKECDTIFLAVRLGDDDFLFGTPTMFLFDPLYKSNGFTYKEIVETYPPISRDCNKQKGTPIEYLLCGGNYIDMTSSTAYCSGKSR